MTLYLDLAHAASAGASVVGAKASALSRLMAAGFNVPSGLCLTTDAYRRYIQEGRLEEKILLQVHRKSHGEMRWEEMWDTALRIRSLFANTPMTSGLNSELTAVIKARFGERPVVVRSSSTIEDTGKASHAGLHESWLNVRSADAIIRHVRLVWASLWSDASLLYSEETGLNMASDAMAVIIQEMVDGDRSGVAFSADPNDPERGVIESVHGLNKGLVDGDVEPDRWFVSRSEGRVTRHDEPVRDLSVRVSEEGVRILPAGDLAKTPPLSPGEVDAVWRTVRDIEDLFGFPQDVEWTCSGGDLFILQARPVTTLDPEGPDRPARGSKAWNLNLKGSLGRLLELKDRIETVHFPRMREEAERLAAMELAGMENSRLADEIGNREAIFRHWNDVYWDEFIPMAHGVRLFGQTYNDVMAPQDPFEFVSLLSGASLVSARRNEDLEKLADLIRADTDLQKSLREGREGPEHSDFGRQLHLFLEEYGDLTWAGGRLSENRRAFVTFLVNLAEAPPQKTETTSPGPDLDRLAEEFVRRHPEGPEAARRILELGRASWRLRDDDNIYLGRIEGQLQAAVEEGLSRLAREGRPASGKAVPEKVAAALHGQRVVWKEEPTAAAEEPFSRIRPRQLVGQPAGGGVARGRARVVTGFDDLATLKRGEVLVCDAIDPNMTLLVPMTCAIVERRGGMLIHGAIIAREAGIPCVNGVPDATRLIRTGDDVTVDGYLGIVIVHGVEG